MGEFRDSAPSAEAVFLRTYSRRKEDGERENFHEAMIRTVVDIASIGRLNEKEFNLVAEQALGQHAFPSGRAFWVAGTSWGRKPENYSGYYNCTSTHMEDLESFGLLVDLAMQGSGTGAVLEDDVVAKLPQILCKVEIVKVIPIGQKGGDEDSTIVYSSKDDGLVTLSVGDSRQGWVDAYLMLIKLAAGIALSPDDISENNIQVILDLSNVRPSGEKLKGFGGTANPVKLESMFQKVANLLANAYGRQLTTVEACLLIDEAATAVVAGNIRRSAGMRQFSSNDLKAATAKDNLYTQDAEGNWKVDPEKEALRMANHTRCYHKKPSFDEIKDAVTKQYYSGEGAIQYVPEAVTRANRDILNTAKRRNEFLNTYVNTGRDAAKELLLEYRNDLTERELNHRMDRYGLNPCGEIIGRDFHCNLAEVHLNTIDPEDTDAQRDAFYAAGLQVAALLQHEFIHERYQYSRSIDPIVGVSFTGLFDFFVTAFGNDWLTWMMQGRPKNRTGDYFSSREKEYLNIWRVAAVSAVKQYCANHDLRVPNRVTTVQPAGTKSLLTGASSGWHPPKAARFIRRITLGISDPLVPALIEYGYSVIPAQSARDDEGNLLDDITDPRVQEVLVEIPTETSWANLPGCDQHDLSRLPVESQWGLYMQVQRHYTDHNTSATIELRENEIDTLAKLIHEDIETGGGYISAALLARFDSNATFPRLPFEPITKEQYDVAILGRQVVAESDDRSLLDILKKYDSEDWTIESVTGCANAACLEKADKEEAAGIAVTV
jgi:ribonucleotide reductase class II